MEKDWYYIAEDFIIEYDGHDDPSNFLLYDIVTEGCMDEDERRTNLVQFIGDAASVLTECSIPLIANRPDKVLGNLAACIGAVTRLEHSLVHDNADMDHYAELRMLLGNSLAETRAVLPFPLADLAGEVAKQVVQRFTCSFEAAVEAGAQIKQIFGEPAPKLLKDWGRVKGESWSVPFSAPK